MPPKDLGQFIADGLKEIAELREQTMGMKLSFDATLMQYQALLVNPTVTDKKIDEERVKVHAALDAFLDKLDDARRLRLKYEQRMKGD